MLFNSIEFMIFFPVILLIYFITPHKFRWILLLGASYYFYMSWNPAYIILIIISTIIDYYAGLMMGKTNDKSKRRKYLILSLISNLGILFTFKYYNFFSNSIVIGLSKLDITYNFPMFKLLLPVGISFYTFQTLSYSIDVYKGKIKPEKHFGIFALYVSFFPQLVAGPIERSERLLPQFYVKQKFDFYRITDGLKLMAWGLFKKVVIADRLAILVNQVYNNPTEYMGLPLILGTVFFAFQIYCDFSGYSDIAIGVSKMMGFDLMKNFDRPYFSKSIPEFWKRWHISLSTWFKDYLYIPLGGNRVVKWRWYYNLFITFLISGLWHGASWTFIAWGCLHGIYQILHISTKKIRNKIVKISKLDKYPNIYKLLQIVITFSLVNYAWIFFRANSISDGYYISTHLFSGLNNINSLSDIKASISQLGLNKFEFLIAVGSIIIMEITHMLQGNKSIIDSLKTKPIVLRWAFYYLIIFSIIIFGVYGNAERSQFIYFQF